MPITAIVEFSPTEGLDPREGYDRLTPQDTRDVVYSILNDDQRKKFENQQQLDFA